MQHLNILTLFSILTLCYSYKILAVFPIPGKSHYILASKLFTELANRGHEVTFITPFPQKNPPKNLNEISVESLQTIFSSGTVQSVFGNLQEMTPLDKSMFIADIQVQIIKAFLSHDNVQRLLTSEETFDAVMVYYYMNDALLPLADHFKAPLILVRSMPLYVTEVSFELSHPSPSSYVPNILQEYTGRMSFGQRLRNAIYDVAMILHYHWFVLPKHRQLVLEHFPNKPELYNLLNNESLILINSHVSTNEATPVVPNAIEVGGYHIEDPKLLPQDLKKFLDESVNGVILFSMGTFVRSADFPEDTRDALIRTFSKLKENVLWKFETELTGLPANIKTMKWIPQADVLAHPNVKLFISHGGLLSTMESVHRGVPILGIPVFADQHMNMALAAAYEYAVQVPYNRLTENAFSQALNEVLTNPKYRENVKRRSAIMRDRPIKPLDNAMFWIEYVIRHQGAPHLRYPGADLRWYQRNLLDVVAFVVGVVLVVVCVMRVVLRRLCKSGVKYKKA